jgi:hypothetical protein
MCTCSQTQPMPYLRPFCAINGRWLTQGPGRPRENSGVQIHHRSHCTRPVTGTEAVVHSLHRPLRVSSIVCGVHVMVAVPARSHLGVVSRNSSRPHCTGRCSPAGRGAAPLTVRARYGHGLAVSSCGGKEMWLAAAIAGCARELCGVTVVLCIAYRHTSLA